MKKLTEEEKLKLKEIIESALFNKAMECALEEIEGPVYSLLAPEQGMALAQEKGARNVFRTLRKITAPELPSKEYPKPKKLHR